MDAQVINISLPNKLLKLADQVAEKEARTRSELFREAIRNYILRRIQWDELFAYGKKAAKKAKFSEQDVNKIIADYRSSNN